MNRGWRKKGVGVGGPTRKDIIKTMTTYKVDLRYDSYQTFGLRSQPARIICVASVL